MAINESDNNQQMGTNNEYIHALATNFLANPKQSKVIF